MTDSITISAQAVNDLRARTGAGLMDCKRALVETQGDAEKAIDFLRAKGLASAGKRADKIAKDGLVTPARNADQTQGALVQLSCETDFVAKTDDFKAFSKALADYVLTLSPEAAQTEAVLKQTLPATKQTVEDSVKSLISKLGENMSLRAVARLSGGFVEHYIHIGGKVGVMVAFATGNAATVAKTEFHTMAKDVAMHIAASSPVCVSRDQVDATLVAKEREIAAEQAKGKPVAALEKIVSGKMEKFYAQNCLLEQPFVKNPDQSVKAMVEGVAKQLGDSVSVTAFVRLQVGA